MNPRIVATAILALPLTSVASVAQEWTTYEHPSLDFAIRAPAGWEQVARAEDKLIYEIADKVSGIHVVLWYTETETDGREYLAKMAHMKDLVVNEDPSPTRIGRRDAWTLNVPGVERNTRVRTQLTVIQHGTSSLRPKEHRLFIVQLWCPVEGYAEHRRLMEEILASVELGQTATS